MFTIYKYHQLIKLIGLSLYKDLYSGEYTENKTFKYYLYLPTYTMKLKCKKCKNEWDYGGDSEWYATCPRCLFKVKVK